MLVESMRLFEDNVTELKEQTSTNVITSMDQELTSHELGGLAGSRRTLYCSSERWADVK